MAEPMKAEELYKLFRSLGLRFKEFKHAPTPTLEDCMREPCLRAKSDIMVKNLWLKDEQKRYYILTALADTRVEFRAIRKALQIKSICMAEEETMLEYLATTPGNLSPFTIFNDKENRVKLLLDERIKEKTELLCHPLHNSASILISLDDCCKFLKHLGREAQYINVVNMETEVTPKAEAKPASGNHTTSPPSSKKDKEGHVLGVTVKKCDNFTEWYTQAIVRGQMIEYYDISGCYVYLPSSYYIWEQFQSWFNRQLQKRQVDNCYFPMFVSKVKLEKEKDHIEGFSPEVAWVTKYGDSDFLEPIAIRPTSETIMYPEFSKWIKSHRDLPLKMNQWNSVVRWEFKQPTPFIRSREFLWQEGHTAHATEEEALKMVYDILELYREYYEDVLAVPVIKGIKSEGEKFAGGKMTTTVETFIPSSGRGIQAATSHLLGTNFAKMFEIEYEDANGEKQLVHQTSWGFTTRSIGIAIMLHGDDKGLVLPPRVAKLQVVVVPIYKRGPIWDEIIKVSQDVSTRLSSAGIRAKLDDRQGYTPGYKYNHWELRGVPIRIEVGPLDVQSECCLCVLRHSGEKVKVALKDVAQDVQQLLDRIQGEMFANAKQQVDSSIVQATKFDEVMPALAQSKCLLLPWCEDSAEEGQVKAETQRRSLEEPGADTKTGGIKCFCIPIEQSEIPGDTKCFWCDKPATKWSLWGRSY